MCLSFCRQISVSLSCVFICCCVLAAAKSLLPNFCECVVCACLSCVCHWVCVGFLVAKLLRLHFMFCMILFDTCFVLVRPALVVLFVSRLLFSTIVSLMLIGSFRVGKFFCICFAFVYFGVCLFFSRWLFVSFVLVWRLLSCLSLVFLRLFFLSLFFQFFGACELLALYDVC